MQCIEDCFGLFDDLDWLFLLFQDQMLVFLQGIDVGDYWCFGQFGVGVGILGFDEWYCCKFDVDCVNYCSGC